MSSSAPPERAPYVGRAGSGDRRMACSRGMARVEIAGVDAGEQRPEHIDRRTGGVDGEGDGDRAGLVGGGQVVVAETEPQERALPPEPPPVLERGDPDGGRAVVGQLQRRAAAGSDRPGRGDLDARRCRAHLGHCSAASGSAQARSALPRRRRLVPAGGLQGRGIAPCQQVPIPGRPPGCAQLRRRASHPHPVRARGPGRRDRPVPAPPTRRPRFPDLTMLVHEALYGRRRPAPPRNSSWPPESTPGSGSWRAEPQRPSGTTATAFPPDGRPLPIGLR